MIRFNFTPATRMPTAKMLPTRVMICARDMYGCGCGGVRDGVGWGGGIQQIPTHVHVQAAQPCHAHFHSVPHPAITCTQPTHARMHAPTHPRTPSPTKPTHLRPLVAIQLVDALAQQLGLGRRLLDHQQRHGNQRALAGRRRRGCTMRGDSDIAISTPWQVIRGQGAV